MIQADELKSIGTSSSLVLLNILLMAAFALTPINQLTNLAFSIPIVGVIFFGLLISGGVYFAKKGIRNNSIQQALGGSIVLQLAYAIFGAGILTFLPSNLHPVVLGVTAVVTTVISILSGLLVYATSHDFSNWRRYSNYMFIGVFITTFIGSLTPTILIIAFLLALGGFITYLVYEIWEMKQTPSNVYLNAIGIYVAFMGVFVEILQIIVRIYAEE